MTPDIAEHDRTFVVWLDKQLVDHGGRTEVRVLVPAGEDADELCHSALEVLIETELDTGWMDAKDF